MKEIKTISYLKGITRTPSDFLCEDGDLAECVNLEVRGQELVPIEMPVYMGVTLGAGEELVYVHAISQQDRKNYITRTKSGSSYIIKAFYIDNGVRKNYSLALSINELVSCVSLGMTLVVYSKTAPNYVLFTENDYKVLGSQLPDVSLSFNLTGAYRLEDEVYTIEETGENNSPYSITDSTAVHQAHVNKFIAEKATGQGKFMYPFFVRYALQLYNGQYTRYSAPVLMLPSIYTSPSVHLMGQTLSGGLKSADFIVGGYVADLQMKVNSIGELENWKDVVKGVSIFITRPTYSYNQAYDDSDNFLKESNPTSNSGTLLSAKCEHIGEITEADTVEGKTVVVNTLPSGYTKFDTKSVYNILGIQTLSVPTIPADELAGDLLASSAVFYKYVAMDTDDLVNASSDYETLAEKYNEYPLETIEQSEKLDTMGDYMTNDILVPSFANAYNSRLNIANITRYLFKGYSPDSLAQQINGNSAIDAYVFIHSESGNDIVVKSSNFYTFGVYGAYLYYPDTDAYKMVLVDRTNNRHAVVSLVEDMYSNGSYYFNLEGITFQNGTIEVSATSVNYETLPNKLFTSDVNNPLYFPLAGINTVGTGRILGISALTRPISQGQFGEYPLMAFCSDGNFALRVDSEGFYSGISPMQEDIILGQDKLTAMENSILAITKKGIMITGASSDLALIAQQMDGKNFAASSLDGLADVDSAYKALFNYANDTEGFRDYLEGARMAYDYSSDRIIIYNKEKSYCYVYMFSNGTVSKLVVGDGDKVITHALSYPDSILQTASGKLYSLYEKQDINELSDRRFGFAVTRPLTLGNPLSLKTVRQIKNMFYRESEASSVKYKIFGSNDNITYAPIRSRYGKPYKYYRLAFFTELLPKESFAGSAIVVEERRNHKLR